MVSAALLVVQVQARDFGQKHPVSEKTRRVCLVHTAAPKRLMSEAIPTRGSVTILIPRVAEVITRPKMSVTHAEHVIEVRVQGIQMSGPLEVK